ncbi:DUF1835 domain-containing protein [uncultured Winogradskyella sp.]|uniref:DUF1835 domain-containing protein n=1 Tax=uncultured Winogradskyella sp. TaxID=395353 RepID=UPI0026088D92|nr:DUF1835 domain-containing protein [uncultured Winogradskyella sp.]|tara:strand:+ start:6191 stop:7123 length:933 start_codon:yes stop_codon:yes gene_type:complete
MINNALHITNGSVLTDYLRELDFTEDILTWQEMLCEGPTIPKIDSEEFFKLRADFLNTTYDIDVDHIELQKELSILDKTDDYTEINLWFEYDLFCHINLLGVINLLHQKEIDKPLYLICSGRIKGEKNLKALGELSPEQIKSHYNNKILLTKEDIDLAIALWRTYCGKDHNIFKPYIVKNSSFKYLSSCLKAHLKRFPHHLSGLGTLEAHILNLIKQNDVKSENHLLGYCLNYQGYYGYGDMQLKRKIKELNFFFDKTENGLELNRKGHDALLKQYNFAKEVNNNMTYGGVKRLDFQFNEDQNKLIKTIT